jgi:hypothetical protein
VSQVTSVRYNATATVLRWSQKDGVTVNVTFSVAGTGFDGTAILPARCEPYTVLEYHSPPLCHATLVWPAAAVGTIDLVFAEAASGYQVSLPIKVGSSTRLLVVGDIGSTATSASVCTGMAAAHAASPADGLIIAGDLSYANDNLTVWDQWVDETLNATALPTLVPGPGNHEMKDLMISYRARFGRTYYSADLLGGRVHVIALNAQELLFTHVQDQYRFLKADLAHVDPSAFVVAFWHEPWYCSNTVHRNSAWLMKEEYEKLLGSRADLVVQGHVHAYQRTLPVYEDKTGTGPIYLTVGTGGNHEGLYSNWVTPDPSWDAAHTAEYGFGTLDLVNATTLHWRFWNPSMSTVMDEAFVPKRQL